MITGNTTNLEKRKQISGHKPIETKVLSASGNTSTVTFRSLHIKLSFLAWIHLKCLLWLFSFTVLSFCYTIPTKLLFLFGNSFKSLYSYPLLSSNSKIFPSLYSKSASDLSFHLPNDFLQFPSCAGIKPWRRCSLVLYFDWQFYHPIITVSLANGLQT